MFWNHILSRGERDMGHPFILEVLKRSRIVPLKISVFDSILRIDVLGQHAGRVRTLRLGPGARIFILDVISFFPSLGNLFYDTSIIIDLPDKTLPYLRALRVRISNLGNLTIPHHFPELWWLHLTYDTSTPLIPLLEALQKLPSLRVLYLFPSRRIPIDKEFTNPIITFHRLEALITQSYVLHLITAPKLSYLDVAKYPADRLSTSEYLYHFCGFDFSTITHIRAEMGYAEDCFYVLGKNNPNDAQYLYPFLIDKHRLFSSDSIFNEIPDFYPNEFYIEFEYRYQAIPTNHAASPFPFIASLNKANNIVEIVLDNLDPQDWTDEQADSFRNVMKRATALRNLIFRNGNFKAICEDYLRDGMFCPHLERLGYYLENTGSSSLRRDSSFILRSSLKLVERFRTCPRPLKIGIQGFPFIEPDALKPFEKLGIRIIQIPKMTHRLEIYR